MTVQFPQYYELNHKSEDYEWFIINEKTIAVWGTAMFSYICHMVIMPIVAELKNQTESRCKAIFKWSVLIEMSLYVLMAVVGYLSFGQNTPPTITLRPTLPNSKDTAMTIAEFCLFFTLNMGVPLRTNAARVIMIASFESIGFKKTRFIYSAITLLLLAIPTAISISFEDIQAIFSILGGSIGTLIMIFWPGIMYIRGQRILKGEIRATLLEEEPIVLDGVSNKESPRSPRKKKAYGTYPDPTWQYILNILYMVLNLILGFSSAIKTLVYALK